MISIGDTRPSIPPSINVGDHAHHPYLRVHEAPSPPLAQRLGPLRGVQCHHGPRPGTIQRPRQCPDEGRIALHRIPQFRPPHLLPLLVVVAIRQQVGWEGVERPESVKLRVSRGPIHPHPALASSN